MKTCHKLLEPVPESSYKCLEIYEDMPQITGSSFFLEFTLHFYFWFKYD